MLARLSDGYFLYSGKNRTDLQVTNCVGAWSAEGVDSAVLEWVQQGRPYTGTSNLYSLLFNYLKFIYILQL